MYSRHVGQAMDNNGLWQDLIPDSILLKIFSCLSVSDLLIAAQICETWRRVSRDESLWKHLFSIKWLSKPMKALKPAVCSSWYEEYKRLYYCSPTQLSEQIEGHTDEVLDATFSHDGKVFCTTSKDAWVKVWEWGYPTKLKYSVDLNVKLSWDLSQYAVFNRSDTMLLICGVKLPSTLDDMRSLGYGAVFRMKDFELVQVMAMDPPHLFADWFDDEICVGGYIDPVTSNSRLNIKAYKVPIDGSYNGNIVDGPVIYSFRGNTHHTMNILIASIPKAPDKTSDQHKSKNYGHEIDARGDLAESNIREKLPDLDKDTTEPLVDMMDCLTITSSQSDRSKVTGGIPKNYLGNEGNVQYEGGDNNFKKMSSVNSQCVADVEILHTNEMCDHFKKESPRSANTTEDKCMIFVSGEHNRLAFHNVNDLCLKLEKKIADLEDTETKITYNSIPNPEKVDREIYIPGSYISGLVLSPDYRSLYFNYRHQIDELDDNGNPKLLEDMQLQCVDLQKFRLLPDQTFTGHKAFSDMPAWYICLDSCHSYIASGSEEACGYLWDRHYRVILARYQHLEGVVNGINFNPVDSECLVTVGDDKFISIWRSKRLQRAYHEVKETTQQRGISYRNPTPIS